MDELISKREALASIKALYPNMMPVIDYFGARRKWFEKNKPYFECENAIMSLQPAKQESKTGHWEWIQYDSNPNIGNWHCSECRTIIPHMPEETDNTPIYKWCPMCGAKMIEPQESEDKE